MPAGIPHASSEQWDAHQSRIQVNHRPRSTHEVDTGAQHQPESRATHHHQSIVEDGIEKWRGGTTTSCSMVSKVLSSICNITLYTGITPSLSFLMHAKVEVRLSHALPSLSESYPSRFADMLLLFDGSSAPLACGTCSG